MLLCYYVISYKLCVISYMLYVHEVTHNVISTLNPQNTCGFKVEMTPFADFINVLYLAFNEIIGINTSSRETPPC